MYYNKILYMYRSLSNVVESVSAAFSVLIGSSGLGDLEVTEYIARIRSGPFEREDGVSVHLATTEARFMAD